ncbi:MAG: hypothetical protein R2911_25830 [Caldilineaceae bacterium]
MEKETNQLEKVIKLGLPKLEGRISTYYSEGAETRAQKLATDVTAMHAFYHERLGIQATVTLAVLNANDWIKVNSAPYGAPNVSMWSPPPVIFMPATSGGLAFKFMVGRKDAIPAELLSSYLEINQTTFETAADEFVDIIGFHELGHPLCGHYRIAPRCHWLNEYIASYFAYAFIAELKPESKKVFELLGRPSKARPKNTTLADFERLYAGVDDYGWYHGMFEAHIQQLYPKMGLQFLTELQRRFPTTGPTQRLPRPNPVPPEEVLEELEKFAPGFESWARSFQE